MPTSSGKILVLSLTGDVHIPYVTKHLTSEYIFVDPLRVLDKCELSYYHDGAATTPIFDGQPLNDIKSVWYRRPYIPERPDFHVPDAYKDYVYTAVRKHTLDLYGHFQDAFWLTDYYTLMKAETKPRQLHLAAKLGFNVPRTLSTTGSKAAAQFMDSEGDVVVKSMATTLPIVNNKVHYFYTTKVAAGRQIDLRGLHVAPAIFQQAIETTTDLRVTVVGSEVFAAAVHDGGQEDYPAIRDWRRAAVAGKLHFEEYKLPERLQEQCVALTHALGLQYGAIDLLVDKQGKYWFLEINPNGQWAFVEDDTGQPIGKAIAGLLERASNPA
jgi:glutathione synthase/RimK-type ligase-like ATP-grasp enzyme